MLNKYSFLLVGIALVVSTEALDEVNIASIDEVEGDLFGMLDSYNLYSVNKVNIGRIGRARLGELPTVSVNNYTLPTFCTLKKFQSGFSAVIVDNSTKSCVFLSKGFFTNETEITNNSQAPFVKITNLQNRTLPLFAAKAKTGLSIEDLYNGMTDSVFMAKWNPYGSSYKSPLMDKWAVLKFDKINFLLYNQGVLQSNLTFNATGSDSVNWFDNKRLNGSFPWNIRVLKSIPSWFLFSIDAYNEKGAVRSFHSERGPYRGCQKDDGLTMILQDLPDNCHKYFFNDQSVIPSRILWSYNSNTGGPGLFSNPSHTREADEVRIEGVIERKDIFMYE